MLLVGDQRGVVVLHFRFSIGRGLDASQRSSSILRGDAAPALVERSETDLASLRAYGLGGQLGFVCFFVGAVRIVAATGGA